MDKIPNKDENLTHEAAGTAQRLAFKPHPWHGVAIGDEAPKALTCYIEIVPADTIKFEMDKDTGYLRVDRPQKYSNRCPNLYGLVPQTYCAERVADYCMERSGKTGLIGDKDPLDICVLSESDFSHGDFLLRAMPVGGLRMIDDGTVDDKIIAVLAEDAVFGCIRDIEQCTPSLVDRLKHYFLTYKDAPNTKERICEIAAVYGREEAYEVINRSREDYKHYFGDADAISETILPNTQSR